MNDLQVLPNKTRTEERVMIPIKCNAEMKQFVSDSAASLGETSSSLLRSWIREKMEAARVPEATPVANS